MKVENFVKTTFLKLTSTTVPYGFEDIFVNSKRDLFPKDMKKDNWGNYYYKIGESRTIFAAHLDTVSKEYVKVNHVFEGNLIKTDGKTTLGADDKAGLTVLLWMIKNQVPGLYYFFIGEEVGCIGSGNAAKFGHFEGLYDRIISFDRRDVDSIITFQSSSRCCSDEFADALCSELNQTKKLTYSKDTGGVYTDSAEFVDIIPECTNVSVGYYREHTTSESQDIVHLTKLAEACVNVDWENLPTKRDPKIYDYQERNYYPTSRDWRSRDYSYYDDLNYDSYDYGSNSFHSNRGKRKKTRRSGKKYYDSVDGLLDITDAEVVSGADDIENYNFADSKFDWILQKYLETGLEYWELQVIKEQYLDMTKAYDKYFYDYLIDKMYEDSLDY